MRVYKNIFYIYKYKSYYRCVGDIQVLDIFYPLLPTEIYFCTKFRREESRRKTCSRVVLSTYSKCDSGIGKEKKNNANAVELYCQAEARNLASTEGFDLLLLFCFVFDVVVLLFFLLF